MGDRTRFALECTAGLLCVVVIPLTCITFDRWVASYSDSAAEVASESFSVYFTLSVIMCIVVFFLTVIQTLIFSISNRHTYASSAVTVATPWISSAAFVSIAIFYSYLVSGGEISLTPYIIFLGIAEGGTFFLTHALRHAISFRMIRPKEESSHQSETKKGKK